MPGNHSGYMGKMLMVDLISRELKEEELDEDLCRRFIGGYGIGARILFSRQKAKVDPLGPNNIFGFVTGPFTGTSIMSGSRYTIVGKSPLTGSWGDANSGGYFGPYMRFAGYDAVFFFGISEKPVYLFLNNNQAELRDASHLWGKDTYATEDILKSELGKDIRVACIGPCGEKQSLLSAVMCDKGRAAARSGLGAVMGSKMVKAVVVSGNAKVPLHDKDRIDELRNKYYPELKGPLYDIFQTFGTTGFTVQHAEEGDSPVKNWGGLATDFPDVKNLGHEPVKERVSKKYACYRCPIACGGLVKEGIGEYKYEEGVHRPEYETLAMFGTNCLNSNLESIIKLNDICNRNGIDTISVGSTVAFAIECFENGIINTKDTDGIELTWGNHKAIVAMTERIVEGKGFGGVLFNGVKIASEQIGKASDKYAIHIQGQELAAHDPKFSYDMATTYKLDATPARHTQGSEIKNPPGLVPRFDPRMTSGRGEFHRISSNIYHIVHCSGMCLFMYVNLPVIDAMPEFLSAVTGWNLTIDELITTGERIANIRQAFNIREGLNPLDFNVPYRVIGNPPKTEGPTAGVTIDQDTLYQDFLAAMDWDSETAKPSKKKLIELGLEDIAQELY